LLAYSYLHPVEEPLFSSPPVCRSETRRRHDWPNAARSPVKEEGVRETGWERCTPAATRTQQRRATLDDEDGVGAGLLMRGWRW